MQWPRFSGVFVEQAFAGHRRLFDADRPRPGHFASGPTVARMLEHALAPIAPPARRERRGPRSGHRLRLSGGGAFVVGQVVSIERLRALHEQARGNLRSARIGNLRLVFGDGRDGVGSMAPYDAIVAAAAGDRIPDAWLMQLKVGARLLAPVSEDGRQTLQMIERTSPSDWQMTRLDTVRFVPLRVRATEDSHAIYRRPRRRSRPSWAVRKQSSRQARTGSRSVLAPLDDRRRRAGGRLQYADLTAPIIQPSGRARGAGKRRGAARRDSGSGQGQWWRRRDRAGTDRGLAHPGRAHQVTHPGRHGRVARSLRQVGQCRGNCEWGRAV
ncbi:MAG: hypothetical protein R3E48_01840 [Burkholderiaceae bacterium]